jgi:perosamine synthetase
MKIPLIKPYITEKTKQKVLDVLDSGYLTEGPVTKEFETAFSKYIGCDHAIAVTSCTTGLELALRALGIGPGDDVIVPDYTYPATAAVVNIVGAHCIIVDVDPKSMLIDYDEIEKAITPNTKAIIPVSLFGNPLDYDRLNQIKSKYDLYIVEDAACSIGAEFQGQKVGGFADITVFSLHPRKFITTGEGGMITTQDSALADWMNSYKHFGMNMNNSAREGVVFEIPGTNYKLSNILAAVGLEQLHNVDELLKSRQKLADRYNSIFAKMSNVSLPAIHQEGVHSYQSYCIYTESRDRIMSTLRPIGIEVQIGTYSLHMHPAFQNPHDFTLCGALSGSIQAYKNCLTLPLYHGLSGEDQDFVVEKIAELI